MLRVSHMEGKTLLQPRARLPQGGGAGEVTGQQEAAGRRGLGLQELLWREDSTFKSQLGILTQVAAPGEGTGEGTRPSCCIDSDVTCVL